MRSIMARCVASLQHRRRYVNSLSLLELFELLEEFAGVTLKYESSPRAAATSASSLPISVWPSDRWAGDLKSRPATVYVAWWSGPPSMPASADALHPFVLKFERHHLVTASAWLSRVVAVGFQLASVRVLTSALGLEQYAVFALLASLAGWYLLADFGVGVSLQNGISEARATDRPYDALVGLIGATGLILLGAGGIALWLAAPAASSYLLEPFAFLSGTQRLRFFWLGPHPSQQHDRRDGLQVWYAEHRGYLANGLIAFSAGLGFAAVTLIGRLNVDDKLGWSIVGYLLPGAMLPLVALAARSGPMLWNARNIGSGAARHLFGRAAASGFSA